VADIARLNADEDMCDDERAKGRRWRRARLEELAPALATDVEQLLTTTKPPPEPSGDLVEQARKVFDVAALGALIADADEEGRLRFRASYVDAGIRAVISHLAALGMGEVTLWPSGQDLQDITDEHATLCVETLQHYSDYMRANVAPILTAMAERVRAAEAARDDAIASRDAKWEAATRLCAGETARANAAEARLARVRALADDLAAQATNDNEQAEKWQRKGFAATASDARMHAMAHETAAALIRSRLDEGAEAPTEGE